MTRRPPEAVFILMTGVLLAVTVFLVLYLVFKLSYDESELWAIAIFGGTIAEVTVPWLIQKFKKRDKL